MFQSERFFREAWPTISQAVESPADAARAVQWILGRTRLAPGTAVLDAPCGFGRHSVEFARRGYAVTGVDFNETELERARAAAKSARVTLRLISQDMRDMEFSGEFDLAVNLFSSIGYFSDDEDRLLIDRFWHALTPDGCSSSTRATATIPFARWRPRSGCPWTTARSASRTASIPRRAGGWPAGGSCPAQPPTRRPERWWARPRSVSTPPTSCGPCSGRSAGARWTSTAPSTARRSRSTRRAWSSSPAN